MGTKESLKEIKIINHLNSDVNRSNRDLNNKDRYKNLYKRDIRKNTHTVKYFQESNKSGSKKLSSKKHPMTKEQRNLLKIFLKENVKENKKAIAKNLIGMFLESNKSKNKKEEKNNNNEEIQDTGYPIKYSKINSRKKMNNQANFISKEDRFKSPLGWENEIIKNMNPGPGQYENEYGSISNNNKNNKYYNEKEKIINRIKTKKSLNENQIKKGDNLPQNNQENGEINGNSNVKKVIAKKIVYHGQIKRKRIQSRNNGNKM